MNCNHRDTLVRNPVAIDQLLNRDVTHVQLIKHASNNVESMVRPMHAILLLYLSIMQIKTKNPNKNNFELNQADCVNLVYLNDYFLRYDTSLLEDI